MSETDTEVETETTGETDAEETHGAAESDEETDLTLIRAGREFEREYRVDASGAGEFLVALGEQLRDDEEVTITDEEEGWELPFAFGDPVELEVDFDGVGDPELEIEVQIPGRTDEEPPSVE
ncbi:amphi-Trp domain-containing protein [Halobaculum sp. MBLA0147]|uniref:amphi-Trp domain-containing protein n=1 Tax=Halobaculum sp. MBLA0147 TaxID=3079934 RepID=UPI00352362A1